MERRAIWLALLVIVTVLGTALAGCATMQKNTAMETEQLLAASGFKMLPADTPEKMAHLKSLPQREFIPDKSDGVSRYIYADSEYCKCMYAGGEKAYHLYYEKYRRELRKSYAEQDWDYWGPFSRAGIGQD